MNGYCGKMLFVDLTKGSHEVLALTEETAKQYIGGYEIGAKVLAAAIPLSANHR